MLSISALCSLHAPLTEPLSFYHNLSVHWILTYAFIEMPTLLMLTIFFKAVCMIYIYIICGCRLSHFLYRPLVNGPGLYLDGQSTVGSSLVFSSLIQSPSIICCLDAALRHPVQGVREAALYSGS